MIIFRLSQRWSIYSLFANCMIYVFNKNFVSSHNVPREPRGDPSNRRLNEYICYLLIVVSMLIPYLSVWSACIGFMNRDMGFIIELDLGFLKSCSADRRRSVELKSPVRETIFEKNINYMIINN